MPDDTITISTLYLKRISYKIQELSKFADQLNMSAFFLTQLCKDLDEACQRIRQEKIGVTHLKYLLLLRGSFGASLPSLCPSHLYLSPIPNGQF